MLDTKQRIPQITASQQFLNKDQNSKSWFVLVSK